MTWLRRVQDRTQPALQSEDDPADAMPAMLAVMFDRVHEVNRLAGRLPVEAVVIARRVLDAVREVLETSSERDLDIHAVIAVRAILEDYLPTTLRSYAAIDPALDDVRRPSGRSPSQSVIEQLDVLWASATDLLAATRAHDADALLTQGSFLRTKFAGSDLDL